MGEKLLRALPEDKRFTVHLELGEMLLGKDPRKAKLHAERAVRANMEDPRALRPHCGSQLHVSWSGSTRVSRIKRSFTELRRYLFRSQSFPRGAMLFTGTGIVPADDFTLQRGDVVTIGISGIGTLINPVMVV